LLRGGAEQRQRSCLETLEIGFRSVVQPAILAERPATLSIFLMERPNGNDGRLKRILRKTRSEERCG